MFTTHSAQLILRSRTTRDPTMQASIQHSAEDSFRTLGTKLLLHGRSQVFRHTQGFDGDINGSDAGGFHTVGTKVGDTFFDGDVVRVLTEKVRLL